MCLYLPFDYYARKRITHVLHTHNKLINNINFKLL